MKFYFQPEGEHEWIDLGDVEIDDEAIAEAVVETQRWIDQVAADQQSFAE